MATVAVFIALGGSSYAAIAITGKNVKNSSLTGADVRNSSLTSDDVKNRSLLAADFKAGQLPSGTSVTSTSEPAGVNCANGGSKFTSADATTYACNGLKGDTGPAGFAGVQQNSFGPTNIPNGQAATEVHGCTSDAFPTLVGGGYSSSPSNVANLFTTVNGPSDSANWQVTISNTSGVSVAFTMYTICAKG